MTPLSLALTQPAAEWLLGKPGVLDQLHDALADSETIRKLETVEFAAGPIRLSFAAGSELLVLWNTDYLSGTGSENWGIVVLGGSGGILLNASISREVLERCVYVVSQRLQGLFIDGAFIHRAYANGAHTCLAGRGTDARQWSIGYVERELSIAGGSTHGVLCRGPAHDLVSLAESVAADSGALATQVALAAAHLGAARRRPAAPSDFLPSLRSALDAYFIAVPEPEYGNVTVSASGQAIGRAEFYRALGWTYAEWMQDESSLSSVQRRLLQSDALDRHPIRIVGPGGSGKTTLMQLLALRCLEAAEHRAMRCRILYLVHNAKMAELVRHRFDVLRGAAIRPAESAHSLEILTLAEYGRRELGLADDQVIDADAHAAKEFQIRLVDEALSETTARSSDWPNSGSFFRELSVNPSLRPLVLRLIVTEISSAIKGHGLLKDERRYVQSERQLSRLHGILAAPERQLVFDVCRRYHQSVFEGYRVLDSDDIALSLLGRLRAPIWDLKRGELGYDYVFVDEAQLFNENERRVLPLLTNGRTAHVPIALALDDAQDIYVQASAGLATLGIANVASESLSSIHRSTRAIVRLAFYVIQRATDLFGPDFPDYTKIADHMETDTHPLAAPPTIEVVPQSQPRLGRFVVKRIRELRKANLWRVCVICYAEQYWTQLLTELRATDLPVRVLEDRGERLPSTDPVVALSRPAHVGGQEFDAVMLVGLEEGLTPPRVQDNEALAVAVEQQAVREIYLGLTRARFRVSVILTHGSLPSKILADAEVQGLLLREGPSV